MAEPHNYSLTIENKTASGGNSPIAGQNNSQQETPSEDKLKASTIVKGLVSFKAFVKPFVQPAIQHSLQTVSLRTGGQEMQQRLQFAYSIGEQALGILESAAIGAAVGNLPGALVGIAVGAMSTIINYANQADTIAIERGLEDISLRGLNVRAGGYAPSYGASRLRNQ